LFDKCNREENEMKNRIKRKKIDKKNHYKTPKRTFN